VKLLNQVLTFFLLLSTFSVYAGGSRVQLKICKLPPVDRKISVTSFEEALNYSTDSKPEAWSEREGKKYIGSELHPFIGALHRSYALHKPFVISPDMIWLLIAQGFSKHVDQNGQKLRHHFVQFEGKKVIHIMHDDFIKGSNKNDWQNVFPEFSKQISKYTGKKLIDNIVINFSTTGDIEKAAFEVTLMDSMSTYFDFSFGTTCGITEIILEGDTADWQKLLDKSKALAQYDLKWWTDELEPILKQFVEGSKGNVDKDFWAQIYKLYNPGSGSIEITGWINIFFPYVTFEDKLRFRENLHTYTTTDDYPSGLSKVDFKWEYHGRKFDMEFLAGFVAIQYHPTEHYFRPEIGWAVRDAQKTKKELHEEREKREYEEWLKNEASSDLTP
jgi:hypothetical protein